jgi:hypothetical protein
VRRKLAAGAIAAVAILVGAAPVAATPPDTNDASGTLPFTGADARGHVGFALVLVTTGLTLIAASLRRARRTTTKGVTR